MTKTSFIYFDVGGVAIKDFSDTPKWGQMFLELGFGDSAVQAKEIYSQYDDEICLGKMAVDDLIPIYREELKLALPDNLDFLQSFVDRFNKNDGLQPIIDQLVSKVRLGLLTDMYLDMLNRIKAKGILPVAPWDQVIDSSVEKLRKPMPAIYALAQNRAKVPSQEILFIDNREKNLVPARQLGWQTFLYDSSNYDQSNAELATFLNLQLPGL